MKKFVIALTIAGLASIGNCLQAEEIISSPENQNEQVTLLSGGIDFDWVNMPQVKRDEMIEHYRSLIYNNNNLERINKKDFRKEYSDYLKDSDRMTHYRLAYYDVKETKDANLSSFFKTFKNQQVLYMYAIQYKNNMKHAFYYDVLGNLRYVDYMSENYPNFPYYSVQYRSNGTIAGTIYVVSQDVQYTYNEDGEFKYLWYKSRMFDKKGKEVMTRTNW